MDTLLWIKATRKTDRKQSYCVWGSLHSTANMGHLSKSVAVSLYSLSNIWASLFLFLVVTCLLQSLNKNTDEKKETCTSHFHFQHHSSRKAWSVCPQIALPVPPAQLVFLVGSVCVWIYFCLLGLNLAAQLLILFLWSRQEGNKTNAFTVLHSGALQWYYSTVAINVQWPEVTSTRVQLDVQWLHDYIIFTWCILKKKQSPPVFVWTELRTLVHSINIRVSSD